jgi:molybdopterin synthase catalytic subunit
VESLLYEAHAPLALSAFRNLERISRRRFGARRVVLWHRTGDVPIGAPSVIVGVAAGHRKAAFAAARFLIDRLKATAPIWKTDNLRPARQRTKR